jgi:hypothetical protein
MYGMSPECWCITLRLQVTYRALHDMSPIQVQFCVTQKERSYLKMA